MSCADWTIDLTIELSGGVSSRVLAVYERVNTPSIAWGAIREGGR